MLAAMKLPRLKTILLAPIYLFAAFYLLLAIANIFDNEMAPEASAGIAPVSEIAIFGASGTAGDGILKAALADPDIKRIHVITRRSTPRIDDGVAAGKVEMTKHMDYLDYEAVLAQLTDVEAVFWALGTSSIGMDEEKYGMIHVDFPAAFVQQWLPVTGGRDVAFQYISSSDISEDSSAMWAREKVRAEKTLFELADSTNLTVVAWRPDYIGPTEEEAHLGQDMLYWFFAPVRAAVRAQQIGESMLEVTARGAQFETGDKLSTGAIIRYSDAYRRRRDGVN